MQLEQFIGKCCNLFTKFAVLINKLRHSLLVLPHLWEVNLSILDNPIDFIDHTHCHLIHLLYHLIADHIVLRHWLRLLCYGLCANQVYDIKPDGLSHFGISLKLKHAILEPCNVICIIVLALFRFAILLVDVAEGEDTEKYP